jgi:DNA-directed RNA polymerase specialized sigma subunit
MTDNRDLIANYTGAHRRLLEYYGREPTVKELARFMGVSEDRVQEAASAAAQLPEQNSDQAPPSS